ncbi:MAG: aldo/keto reductase [Desulfopila sp.]
MHNWTDLPLSEIPADSISLLLELARAALGHGINHFETAHGYGSSERQLGQILNQFNRKDIILQTKVVPHQDPRVFQKRFSQSLERLGVEYIDLLGLHGINDYRSLWASCRQGGCLAAARDLQRQGKVGHIGFSGHGPLDVIEAAIAHREDGGFDYLNLHWYYIFDVNRPAIERAAKRDLGVCIISPTDKGGMLYQPPRLVERLCKPLSPIAFNDLYCLTEPGVTTIGVGAANPDDFTEHLQAQQHLVDERPPIVLEIITRLENEMEKQIGARRPEHNWHNLPEWDSTPGNINLRFIDWLHNLTRGWGFDAFGRYRYTMLAEGSAWVPGNLATTLDHLDFLQIMEKYPVITPAFLAEIRAAHNRFTSEGQLPGTPGTHTSG